MPVREYSPPAAGTAGHPDLEVDKTSLARAIEQAAEAVVITDAAGTIRYVNPAFTSMTGYPAEEAIGRNPSILKSNRQDARYYEELWRTIREGRAWHGQLINRRKDGTLYTEEMSITPVRDALGETTGYIAIKQDVTERRAAEEERRVLASIVESAGEGIIAHTPDGRIATWNRAAAEIHGYSAEEVIGKPIEMLLAPESVGLVRGFVEGLRKGETFHQMETVVRRKNGEKADVLVSLCPIRDGAGAITATAAIVRDITGRKRDQRALEVSEERFRTAFEYAPFGICLSTPEGGILRANATFCRILGYSEAELIERGWLPVTHPEDRAASREQQRLLLRGQSSGEAFEKRYIRKDGTVVWTRVRISVLNAETGRPSHFVTHIEDITEQRRAHESLRRSEEKYRRLVANLPDVIWSASQDGAITYISPNVESVFGYTAAEVRTGGIALWLECIHPADRARLAEAYQVLFALRRPLNEEYRMRRKDGEWTWVHSRAMRAYEEDGTLFADGVISDIAARRRAEEGLAQSEKRYRLLFERNLAGVFRALPDERLVDCNEALLEMLGYSSAAEFLSRRASELFYDRAEQEATFARLYRERRLTNHDVRLKRKDGTAVWVLENASLVEDDEGRPAFIEGTLFDITDRKRAEEALRESEQKYRALVTNIPDVVWTADAGGRLVFVSPNCEAIFGYTQEEMCDPGFRAARIHPEDLPKVRDSYAAFLEGRQTYNVEYRIVRKDGLHLWVQDRAFATYERRGGRYADGCASDISNPKLYQAMIAQLQRRTELILNSAGEGIVGLDADGFFTFVNPAAARMFGSTPEALLLEGEFHRVCGHAHADGTDCARVDCGILASLRDGNEHRGAGETFRSAAGERFSVEYTSTPKFDQGELAGAVVVFRDTTEARRARERIEASLREKEALLREIHHRVKNNLQIVCSLLKLNSRGLRDAEAQRVFENTRHRVKAMALVHETLYQSGDLAGIDFSRYIPRLADQLLHAYGLSRAQVRVSLDVERLVLPIDTAIPCALMLTELISNAAKHSFVAAGGGRLEIALRRAADPCWLLQVKNSAGGAASNVCPPAGTSSFGLELVNLLAEQLSGSLEIERAPAFSVSVTFPLGEELNRGSIV